MNKLALVILISTFAAHAQTAEPQAKVATKRTVPAEAKPSDKTIGEGMKACVPGDDSPAGTVVDGYKKVLEPTPFGVACRWVAVK